MLLLFQFPYQFIVSKSQANMETQDKKKLVYFYQPQSEIKTILNIDDSVKKINV